MEIKVYKGMKDATNTVVAEKEILDGTVAVKRTVDYVKANVRRYGAFATAGVVLATGAAFAEGTTDVPANDTTTKIVEEANLSVEEQLLKQVVFVNHDDILAYRFLANIESIAAYVEKNGVLPKEYASLDLESLDFDKLLNMSNRINDALGNTAFDAEMPTVSPAGLLDNADEGHVKLINMGLACVETLAQKSMTCWFEGKGLAEDPEARKAVEDFMNLTRQARTYLTSGEYDIIWIGLVQNAGAYILADGSLMNEYLDSFIGLGAGNDFDIQEINGQWYIAGEYHRTAELTDGIREDLGYVVPCAER